jgi:hypothetical protein
MENLPQEVLDRLDLLADKLGVASGQVWEILINQASIDFYVSLCVFILCAILEVVALRIGLKSKQGLWGGTPGYFIGCFIPGVIGLMSFADIIRNVGYLLNPEYYALTKILEIIS